MRFNAITLAVLGTLAVNFNTFAQAPSSSNDAELNDALAAPTDKSEMERIIAVGEAMEQPLMVVANPKHIRQPLPAHDAADYLKSIAGFSTIRKGGASGDLLFRGMAASRVNILADGETLLIGCGNSLRFNRINAASATSRDYEDGSGTRIHSAYECWCRRLFAQGL